MYNIYFLINTQDKGDLFFYILGEDEEEAEERSFSKALRSKLNFTMFEESNLSAKDIMDALQAVKIKHKFSQEAVSDLFEMTKLFAGPRCTDFNITNYHSKNYKKDPEIKKLYSFYCPEDAVLLVELLTKEEIRKQKKTVCTICQKEYLLDTSKNNYFINLDLEYQIRSMLSEKDVFEAVLKNHEKYKKRAKEGANGNLEIRDIFDAELYKRNTYIHCRDKNEIVLTINGNADGGKMFHKTKYSLWLLTCQLNELPDHLRFKVVFTVGLWYTAKEPKPKEMQLFMKCFVKQMYQLMHVGMTFTHNDQTLKIFVLPLMFAVDAPARAIISNRINHGGFFGCSWCYEYGKTIAGSVKFPIEGKPAELRSHASHLKDIENFEKLTSDQKKRRVLNVV